MEKVKWAGQIQFKFHTVWNKTYTDANIKVKSDYL